MKTITEYQPMIFSALAAHSLKRCLERRQLIIDLIMVIAYSSLGLWLSFDTGLAPWNWQFWLMFTPLFLAGEIYASSTAIDTKGPPRGPEVSNQRSGLR